MSLWFHIRFTEALDAFLDRKDTPKGEKPREKDTTIPSKDKKKER